MHCQPIRQEAEQENQQCDHQQKRYPGAAPDNGEEVGLCGADETAPKRTFDPWSVCIGHNSFVDIKLVPGFRWGKTGDWVKAAISF